MKKPLGVWFSLVIVIFVLATCVGVYAGRFAAGRYFIHQQRALAKSNPEQATVNSIQDELSAISMISLMSQTKSRVDHDPNKDIESALHEVAAFKSLRTKTTHDEVRSVADMKLGFAYVHLAAAQEKMQKLDDAQASMKLAQDIFHSLGWHSYSELDLKTVDLQQYNTWGIGLAAKRREQ